MNKELIKPKDSQILLIDNHSKNIDKLSRLMSVLGSVSVCDCDEFNSEKADSADLVVLSGGSHVFAAESTKKAYEQEIEFIRNSTKPIIGICLGCQLIAKAFGGRLKKLDEKMHGLNTICFKNVNYSVYESHKYSIEYLSSDLVLIAESATGPEIIAHKERLIYGFQFHPEVFPIKSDGKKLFLEIVQRI